MISTQQDYLKPKKKEMKKWILKSIESENFLLFMVMGAAVSFFIPFVAFFCKKEFSDEWATPFWSLTGVCAVTIFSFLIYRHTKALETPIITAESVGFKEKPYYIVKNIGQVSATNILLFIKGEMTLNNRNVKGEYEYMVIVGSMTPNSKLAISWEYGMDFITITYRDFNGDEYTSIVVNDELTTFKGNEVGIDSRGKDIYGVQKFEKGNIIDFKYGSRNPYNKWIRYSTLMQDKDFANLAAEIVNA
jgi:hypothetical protein